MGISIWQLLIVLAIVLLLFGSKKLKNLGSDLGGAIRGFKKSIKDGESPAESDEAEKIDNNNQSNVIEGEVTDKTKEKEKI
jgi:sec-independent protein translocase protein TatA